MKISFGEPIKKLRAVPIRDNGEGLVDPTKMSQRILYAKEHPVIEGAKRSALLRESVAKKLVEAASKLPDGIGIVIMEGYRPLAQQRQQHAYVKKMLTTQHPKWNKSVLQRAVNSLSAPPDDQCPPPHSTGAAVDLNLVDMRTGKAFDMTSPFDWDEQSARTDLLGLTKQSHDNRRLLIDTLESVGLTNYAGEW